MSDMQTPDETKKKVLLSDEVKEVGRKVLGEKEVDGLHATYGKPSSSDTRTANFLIALLAAAVFQFGLVPLVAYAKVVIQERVEHLENSGNRPSFHQHSAVDRPGETTE